MKPVFSLIIFLCLFLISLACDPKNNRRHITANKEALADSLRLADSVEQARIAAKADEAFEFCAKNKYDTSFCLLIDMRIHSGLTRFFVWDFSADAPADSGLVSHGCGDHSWGHDETKSAPEFSNVYESHCSSTGKYKIGDRGYSNWGIHVNYAMHGLDSTNSNSFGRNICMHSWDMVDDFETFPQGTPEGWGCAAVSDNFMRRLDKQLQKAEKPVLLWIFY